MLASALLFPIWDVTEPVVFVLASLFYAALLLVNSIFNVRKDGHLSLLSAILSEGVLDAFVNTNAVKAKTVLRSLIALHV